MEECMYCYNGVCFKPAHSEDAELAAPSERCHGQADEAKEHHIIV